jgi:hypothetical protein
MSLGWTIFGRNPRWVNIPAGPMLILPEDKQTMFWFHRYVEAWKHMSIPGSDPDVGFEIEPFGGANRRFGTIGEVRSAILRGEIPRTANIRTLDGPAGGKSATVED